MQCPEGYSKDVWDALPPELQEELAPNASARVPGCPQPKQKSLLGFLDGGGPAVDLTKKEAQSSSPNSPQRKVKQAKLSRDNGTIGVAGLDYGAEEEKSFTSLHKRPESLKAVLADSSMPKFVLYHLQVPPAC